MDRNYIRADTLSFSSIEVYMLMFLLVSYIYILIKFNLSLSMRLLCMYILALPYTDIVYRFMGIQISEMVIFLIIINDIANKKIRIKKTPLYYFMIGILMILCTSTVFSVLRGVYGNRIYGENLTSINSILNDFKFIMIIYVTNKLVLEINTKEKLDLVISMIRFSGNVAAFTTIMQAVMYKLGFVVPGIFEMWGIPRAKGLSHEPATNAFVLMTTIAISTFYATKGKLVVHKKSLVLQMVAFIICFSSGAIPILLVYLVTFGLFAAKDIKITRCMLSKVALLLVLCICVGMPFLKVEVVSEALGKVVQKLFSILSDYKGGTNISGRGGDMQSVKMVMKYNPMLGIGSFNSTIFLKGSSNTNTYLVLLVELGIIGMLLFMPLLFFYIHYFTKEMRKIRHKNFYANEMAFLVISLITIAWLRVFFFHQIWVVFAIGFAAVNVNQVKNIEERNGMNCISALKRCECPLQKASQSNKS